MSRLESGWVSVVVYYDKKQDKSSVICVFTEPDDADTYCNYKGEGYFSYRREIDNLEYEEEDDVRYTNKM